MNPDRLPPNSDTIERAVLGAILQSPHTGMADLMTSTPNAGHLFYDLRHRTLVALIADMVDAGRPVDSVTLGQSIIARKQEREVGGLDYVAKLPENAPTPGLLSHYLDQLKAVYLRRELVRAGTAIATAGFDEHDPALALETAEREVMAIRLDADFSGETDIKTAVKEAISHFEDAVVNRGRMRGLSTGIYDFDRLLRGLKAGQLITIAGRPGEGKTSLAIQIAEHNSLDNKLPVAVFSMEMTQQELVQRIICGRSRIPSDQADAGNLSEDQIADMGSVAASVAKSSLHICDRGGLSVSLLRSIARRMKQRHNIELLIVDSLQLMYGTGKPQNRTLEIQEITSGLKSLAKELRVPVIALSQLNREYDKDRRREPRLSDLRDSGSIEQDSDIVVFIHPDQSDADKEISKSSLLVKKNRNGKLGKVAILFNKPLTRFESYSRTEEG